MTTIQPGDEVNLSLSNNELVVGIVEATDVEDVFSEKWTVTAVVTEEGHPLYGQLRIFTPSEIELRS